MEEEDTEKGAVEGSDWMAHLPELTSGQQHSTQTFPNLGATIKKAGAAECQLPTRFATVVEKYWIWSLEHPSNWTLKTFSFLFDIDTTSS